MCINKSIYQDSLAAAFAHFNKELFAGALPQAVVTLHAKKNSAGHFASDRWTADGSQFHEININPTIIEERGERQVLSTLAHEMAHLWQEVFGKPPRSGYHNREWVVKMQEIGLEPVSLDSKNGTGQRVTHDIIEGGAFAKTYEKLIGRKSWTGINWHRASNPQAAKTVKKTKVKYTCMGCDNNVWGKPGMTLICNCEDQIVNPMVEN